MPEIFGDTAGWANFFVRTEPFHAQAVQLMQQWHKSQSGTYKNSPGMIFHSRAETV